MTGTSSNEPRGDHHDRRFAGPELRNHSWAGAAPLLRLRLRTVGDTDICGLIVGDGLRAEVVLDGPDFLMPIRAWMAERWKRTASEVVCVAWRQTLAQRMRWSTSSVLAGDDTGSRLIVGGGGRCASGVVTQLQAGAVPGLRLPALVSVPDDHVVIIAISPAGGPAAARAALATRLLHMQQSLTSVSGPSVQPHRRILLCRRSGRLTIFGDEDAWNR